MPRFTFHFRDEQLAPVPPEDLTPESIEEYLNE